MINVLSSEVRRRKDYESLKWGAHQIDPNDYGKVHDIETIMYRGEEVKIQRYETPDGEEKTVVRKPNLPPYEKNEIWNLLPGEHLIFW